MFERFAPLRTAKNAPSTAHDRLTLDPLNLGGALGTDCRHLNPFGGSWSIGHHDTRDLGDHIAGAMDNHSIANAHIQTFDFIHIVQRGITDRDPADKNRFKPRDRR